MRPVAVAGFGFELAPLDDGRTDAELLGPAVDRALSEAGVDDGDVGFVCSAGSEFVGGVVGGVMGAFDALPGWPPRGHTHLEGDGAFAFYECWVRLLAGEADVALAGAFSRPLGDDPDAVLAQQMDPYLINPLGVGPTEMAALQARLLIDSGRHSEADLARVVRARRGEGGDGEAFLFPPLRPSDCSTPSSGAAAVVLVAGSWAEGRPAAWITGMEHRIERHYPGARDLADSPSIRRCATGLGLSGSQIDVLECHAPFSHQELMVVDAIGAAHIGAVNPSGGCLPADPVMATGLLRLGWAASAVLQGRAGRAVGHATSGPCLQHNLLCAMADHP